MKIGFGYSRDRGKTLPRDNFLLDGSNAYSHRHLEVVRPDNVPCRSVQLLYLSRSRSRNLTKLIRRSKFLSQRMLYNVTGDIYRHDEICQKEKFQLKSPESSNSLILKWKLDLRYDINRYCRRFSELETFLGSKQHDQGSPVSFLRSRYETELIEAQGTLNGNERPNTETRCR